ncbi:hypothetical protein [Bacteroides gallinarum]|nr:hypothetical protein [Bacteroides gallinarum]
MRFLAIIQIDESNTLSFADVKQDADGAIRIGDYLIKGQTDTGEEARLEIENHKTGEYLLYGPTGDSNRAEARRYSHSTLLCIPENTGGYKLRETVDRYPLMIPEQNPAKKTRR